jgi:putative redox protein
MAGDGAAAPPWVRKDIGEEHDEDHMATTRFDFSGSAGSILSGRLEVPTTTPRGWAIFAHCLTCGKESHAAVRISRSLASAGIGVLRFDFAGVGKSEGEFGTGIADSVEDLLAAVSAMTAAGMPPRMMVGHSFGGAAVLAAASRAPGVEALVAIATPANAERLIAEFEPAALDRLAAGGAAGFRDDGRDFLVSERLIADLRERAPVVSVRSLGRPLLLLQSPDDQLVAPDNATEIFAAAQQPKSIVALDGADHLLNRAEDGEYTAAIIAAWSQRYLPPLVDDLVRPEDAVGVVATETRQGRFQLAMQSGSHRFLADEPVEVGGLDSGLSPYDFVSAGLAACTTMTMRLYAERKKWPLVRAKTSVEHIKQGGETPRDTFVRTISLEGDLDEEQRARILAIANRCPVDLTLVRGSEVETKLL